METFECIRQRRDIRAFKDIPIPPATIEKILAAAIQAPSADNTQEWEFVVVESTKTKDMLADAAFGQDFITKAPVVIVVCSDTEKIRKAYGERGVNLYTIQGTAAATQNLLLAAWDMDIGGCWVGAFNESKVAEALFLPQRVRPLAMVPLGIPASMPSKPGRKPLGASLHKERY